MPLTVKDIPVALGIGADTIRQVTGTTGNARKYILQHIEGEPEAPSVTSIVDGTLRSYGLEVWKASHISRGLSSAEGKVLTPEIISSVLNAAPEEASRAALVGSELHTVIDLMLQGDDVEVPVQLEPAIIAFNRWRSIHDWEYIDSEVAVYKYDPTTGVIYAGTIDALFKDEWGDFIIVDWKSSSGIYESAMLQVSAYADALQTMLNSTINTGNSNGTHYIADDAREVPALVKSMVVRFHNSYPVGADGRKDRSQPKVFEDKVEFAWVDQRYWEPFFLATYALGSVAHAIEVNEL